MLSGKWSWNIRSKSIWISWQLWVFQMLYTFYWLDIISIVISVRSSSRCNAVKWCLFYLFPPGFRSSSLLLRPELFSFKFRVFFLSCCSVSSFQPPFVPCHSDRVLCVCVCQDQRPLRVSTKPVTTHTPPPQHVKSTHTSWSSHQILFLAPPTSTSISKYRHPSSPSPQKYPSRGKCSSHHLWPWGFRFYSWL